MTISVFTGTPRSGKSLNAVKKIFEALYLGKYVIANFAIKFNDKQIKRGYAERFYYVPNENFTITMLIEFYIDKEFFAAPTDKLEGQCLVVYDEAGGKYNSRDFNRSDRAEWIDFFSQHGKLGFDFILVAQNDRMIDKQIRGYIEHEVKHRKLNNFSKFKFLSIFRITMFVAIQFWYPVKERVGSEFFPYMKKWGEAYDTHKMFSGFKLSDALLAKINNLKDLDLKLETPMGTIFNDSGEE